MDLLVLLVEFLHKIRRYAYKAPRLLILFLAFLFKYYG